MTNKKFTFFGSIKVPFSHKTEMVNKLYSKIANRFDLINDLLTLGAHRFWKDTFCILLDNPNAKLLDMAAGTCDISKRFYEFSHSNGVQPDIVACDLNKDILSVGKEKLLKKGITEVEFKNFPAENISFEDSTFDYYCTTFGVVNFTDISKSLQEAYRVLKKGGKFLCMEYSKKDTLTPKIKIAIKLSTYIISAMRWIVLDRESYSYLVDSLEKFPTQAAFIRMLKNAGFVSVSSRTLSSGIVSIYVAYKE